ncbi:MAG: hypothetical protein ABIT09_11085 [Croceibacterium sp.]
MAQVMILRALILLLAALVTVPAGAQSADFYRGGWRTATGDPQVYEFVIDGRNVSGISCTLCSDGTTLARIEGTFTEGDGIAFVIRHVRADGSLAAQDRARARLVGSALAVTVTTGAGGKARSLSMIKDPRGPTPGGQPQAILPPGSRPVAVLPATGGGGGGRPAPYVQPAKWRQLSAADVLGVWLGFGVGIEKQYFVIRRDGARLFGLACGRCDNPYTFGALDNFAIHGDTLEFDIRHEDWGEGRVVPFPRHVTAHIAMNEMRIDARRADIVGGAPIVSSLVGPIALEATRGNVVGE